MVYFLVGCARAARGHAAAPPRSVMKLPALHLHLVGKGEPGWAGEAAGTFTADPEGEAGKAVTAGDVAVAAARQCATYAFSVVVL
jgi:hypothetical protein